MRQYNLIQAFFMSFYSRKLYRDIALNWGGFSYLYLFLLIAITSIPAAVIWQKGVNEIYDVLANQVITQFPVIKVESGKVVTPENHPYFVVDPKTKKNLVVIDSSGKYQTLEEAQSIILVTKDKILSHKKNNETRIYSIPTSFSYIFDPQKINQIAAKSVSLLWVPFYIVFLLACFVYRIIQALFYGLFGKIFSLIVKSPLLYGQIVQIALVSITPVIVLSTVLDFFVYHIPYLFFCYFILAMVYLFYGILANKNAYPVIPVSNQDNLK